MDPSACIPFIPHTERIEILKIYGEAPDTVSVSIVTASDPEIDGCALINVKSDCRVYVNFVLSLLSIVETFVDILYLESLTPVIRIGVPTFRL